MKRNLVVAIVAAALLVVAGCGNDTSTSSTTTAPSGSSVPATGTEPGTTAGTSPVVAGVSVDYDFVEAATPDQAAQAAEVMTKRLEFYGYAGSSAEVNNAGDGLSITVGGVTDAASAVKIVDALSISGALTFRPALQGPLAPAPGEQPAPKTAEVLAQLAPGTTAATSDIPTTPAAEDSPAGQSVLTQIDIDGLVIARWEVGPAELDATAVSDANVTTHNGVPAVQIVMNSGSPGIDQFNAMAQACFEKSATCPTGINTIVFDSYIVTVSAVSPDATTFTPFTTTGVVIWSPDWTTDQAKALAAIIKVGEMPVEIVAA